MKNVLVLVHDDAGQEARLQAALDLTRALKGHLNCLDVAILPALAADPYCTDGSAILLEEERDREGRNRARIEERLAREDVSWDISAVTGDLAPAIEAAAGLADVVVVNLAVDGFPFPAMRELVGDLLARSRKPIFAVPDEAHGFNAAGAAIIAWDGSAACIAALQASAPLLQLSASVVLLEIDDGSLTTPATEAAAYLSRHDIHPLIRKEPAQGRKAGDVILQELALQPCDYLVMGGFGHRRFVERLFGGVTRTMLSHSPVPIFLAHT